MVRLVDQLKPWLAISISALSVLLVGAALVLSVTVPLFASAEWGIVVIMMYLVCYLGCIPAAVLPFVFFCIARRIDNRRMLLAGVVIGLSYPVVLGSLIVILPQLYQVVGLGSAAREFGVYGMDFLGQLDINDNAFWTALLPFALAAGIALSHFALGPGKQNAPARPRR